MFPAIGASAVATILVGLPALPGIPDAIGACIAQAAYPSCIAYGTAPHPRTITIGVTSSPGGQARVFWDVFCVRDGRVTAADGSFHGAAPLAHQVRLPVSRPGSCDAAADAVLASGGVVRVTITARRG